MPVYNYQCENCGLFFDQIRDVADRDNAMCPKCRRRKCKRIIQPTRAVFKGPGFYKTDNAPKEGKGE